MNTRYFRAGAGTVIYNAAGEVAWFQRAYHPVGVWQFQQGGIDAGEAPESAMWRELGEEVGLRKEDFASIIEYPHWTIYEFTPEMIAQCKETDRLGQVHRWWFLKLRPEVEIDLTKATDKEFCDWQWTTFEDAIKETHELKRHVYEELFAYFKTLNLNV